MPGKVYLIPNVLSDPPTADIFNLSSRALISTLRIFFVEEIKSARRLLRALDSTFPLEACQFFNLNEHTPADEIEQNFQKIGHQNFGIISEAGCPCVADPGAAVVRLAHRAGYEIVPLIGPSSILLALMSSGLNGQNFAFNGYLPKERDQRIKRIRELEHRSALEQQTQLFMEAPYRNQNLFEDLLQTCMPATLLSVAMDLTSPMQFIKTQTIRDWQKEKIDLHKKPVIFLLQK